MIIPPGACISAARGPLESAFAVLEVVLPLAFVVIAIGPLLLTLAVFAVFEEFAFVDVTIYVSVFSSTMHFVIFVLTSEGITIVEYSGAFALSLGLDEGPCEDVIADLLVFDLDASFWLLLLLSVRFLFLNRLWRVLLSELLD